MKSGILVTMGLIAALMTAGCSGQTTSNTQKEAARTAATEQNVQEQGANTAEQAAEAATKQAAEAATEQAADIAVQVETYESTDGWKASYDKNLIKVSEEDGVTFVYTGEAEETNQIKVKYYAEQMPDEALGNAMSENGEMPEHTRSEGYFAGRTDVWSMRTHVDSEENPGTAKDYIAVEHNGGTLVLEITSTGQADEKTGMEVSDTLAAIVDSFELIDQEPQTYSQWIPGKYMMTSGEEIEGQEVSSDSYVQLNEDHTGTIHMQDDIQIIWYSREGRILSADSGEQIFEYVCEGDTLYLNDPAQEGESLMFTRQAREGNEADTSAAAEVQKDR